MEATENQKKYLKNLISWYHLSLYPKNDISKEECSTMIQEALDMIEKIKTYRKSRPRKVY